MSTLFISHSSADNEIAVELERRLAEQNHTSVFLDLDPEKGIVAGQSWERTLYRKLRACRAVIVLCTDIYLKSHWCFAEIALARMEGKHILALQVEGLSPDANLPSILTEKQFIDLRTNPEEGYQRLWHGLKEMDLLGVSNEWDPKQSPYLGLSAYQEQHAAVFFGRDEETRVGLELLDRGSPGLVMVLGASGSGKSSMVRAGMVPRLRQDTGRWIVVGPFRPRRDPFAELAESLVVAFANDAPDEVKSDETRERINSLRRAGPGANLGDGRPGIPDHELLSLLLKQLEALRDTPSQTGDSAMHEFLDWSLDDLRRICGTRAVASRIEKPSVDSLPLVELADHLRRASDHQEARVLLVIDQFEELLGHEDAGNAANRFLNLLRNALEAEHSPLMALGTMRSDFLGLFQRNRALLGIDFESLSVGPMSIDGMRRVIEEPAKLGALELERGLADSLLADTETPDALPLLSFTLSVLWKGRQNGTLSVRQYNELDGLHGAVAREAEAVLDSARRQGKEDDVRRAFLQMARLAEDGSYARQPVNWDREEVLKVAPILEEFEKRRLLVTRMEEGEERVVEVVHEALFRSWDPLKSWLDDHRGELLLEAHLRRDAQAWEENDHAKDNLWHGGRLQQAAELMREGKLGGGSLVRTSVRTSEERFVQAGLLRRRIQRGTLAGVTLSIIAALTGFLLVAISAKTETTQAAIHSNLVLVPLTRILGFHRDSVFHSWVAYNYLDEKDPLALTARNLIANGSFFGPPLRHEGVVYSAMFDSSGDTIVTASYDKTAQLWNSKSGEKIGKPILHANLVRFARFSPDGKKVVTASYDSTARIVDAATGETIWVLGNLEQDATNEVGHTGKIYHAEFSPDGTKVATGSADGTARLWDVETGLEIAKLEHEGNGRVRCVSFSPDNSKLVTSSGERAFLWELETSTLEFELRMRPENPGATAVVEETNAHKEAVVFALFSPDSERIVTTSQDDMARLWDVGTGQEIESLKHSGNVWSADFSPDGSTLVTADETGAVSFWQGETGGPKEVKLIHEGLVRSVKFSGDGKRVVTASYDGTARVWNAATGKQLAKMGHGSLVRHAEFGPEKEGTRIVTACQDGTSRIWEVKTAVSLGEPDQYHSAFDPSGGRVATAHRGGSATIWDLATGEKLEFKGHELDIRYVAFSPDGKKLVTAAGRRPPTGFENLDHTALVWDAATGAKLSIVKGQEELEEVDANGAKIDELRVQEISSAAFSPDGLSLVTGSGTLARIWNVQTEKAVLLKTLHHSEKVNFVDFSPDGTQVATASGKAALVWNVEDESPKAELRKAEWIVGHDDIVWFVGFSPGGARLLTASQDSTAQLWQKGQRLVEDEKAEYAGSALLDSPIRINGHMNYAGFSPGGDRIVTAGQDEMVQLWDAHAGHALGDPYFHDLPVRSVAFSPRGDQIITTEDDELGTGKGVTRLWDVPPPAAADRERLRLSVELRTGYKLNQNGRKRALDLKEWQENKEKLEKLNGPSDVRSWESLGPQDQSLPGARELP